MAAEAYAIELGMDDVLKSKILDAIKILKDNNFIINPMDTPYEPRITILVTDFWSELNHLLPECIPTRQKLPISLSCLAISPRENNISLTPARGFFDVVEFHDKLCNALTAKGLQIPQQYKSPSWEPRCTLAPFVPGDKIPAAIGLLLDHVDLPLTGYVEHIELVQSSPNRHQLSVFPFPSGGEE